MQSNKILMTDLITEVYRTESRRVLATLIRLLGDFDLAEEALADAFVSAADTWPREGVPENPRAWLISTGRFKAIDNLRRRARIGAASDRLRERQIEVAEGNQVRSEHEIEDDRLRLIFTCCHPALDPQVQIALTLREVCGLTTEAIAAAFLTAPATMAQRIVRGKAKIRAAGIPFQVPESSEFSQRIESVLSVCYLIFNEGYSASSGPTHTRKDLSAEAIRLGRLLGELVPDAEVFGLLSLMLFHESRREARSTTDGELVLLEDQDRLLWNRTYIEEGRAWFARALEAGEIGQYTIQAGISAVHVDAPNATETNWEKIVQWYDLMMRAAPSAVVELNRAVAIAMRDGPQAGLALLESLQERKELADYHLLPAAKADLLRRAGYQQEAATAYRQALALVKQEPERKFLEKRLKAIAEK